MYKASSLILVLLVLRSLDATIHTLTLRDDGRKNFPLSTFGFYTGGKLAVSVNNFTYVKRPGLDIKDPTFGFSLQKSKNDGVSSYMEKTTTKCLLENDAKSGKPLITEDMQVILLNFNLNKENPRVDIQRHGKLDFTKMIIEPGLNHQKKPWTVKEFIQSHWSLAPVTIQKESCNTDKNNSNTIDIISETFEAIEKYSVAFTFNIDCAGQEGLYNLYFHNCGNYIREGDVNVNFELDLVEHNDKTYLSAGEIPLPVMYGFMSCAFFTIACYWICFLRKYRSWSFKIHWLMAGLVYFKSISVAFHAINYYYIGVEGLHVRTWAIIYYMLHLLKGALLFTTIVLIGTGYFFVKHVLSKKEKNLFMIVIPLQIIANVAQIMIESTEEGDASYKTLSQITTGVDLLCCGAILLPVIWSIKHLSEAAKTDGKAAISLQKLKLFRHFYVMIVVYIYFTRIVVYLIKITVPFQFMWLDEFFTEAATFCFFLMTGYTFRPVNNNPYLHLPQEDDLDADIEMNDINAQSAYGDRLTRVNKMDVHPRNT